MMSDMSRRGPDPEVRPSGSTAPSPAATRVSRRRWRDPRMVVGVVVVAACALLGATMLGGADDTVGVWAATRSMNAGEPVRQGDLVRRDVHFAAQRDADAYLSADAPLPTGSTLARPVGAGEMVPRGALGTQGSGALTEVPLSVDAEAVPSTLRVGAVVDVWVTPDDARAGGSAGGSAGDASTPRSALVFDDVAVLSAPRGGSSLGPTATRQVIVGVGRDQETRLPTSLAALAGGAVILTVQR